MYIGAIDIETICPGKSPPEIGLDESKYVEPTAIGVGRMNTDTGEVESDVLFRRGGVSNIWTRDLLEQTISWFETHEIDAVLTYNGKYFDEPHLLYWAERHDFEDEFEQLFETHIDLYTHFNRETGFEEACIMNGISPPSTKYKSYDIATTFDSRTDSPAVSNKHIGTFLGNFFIELVESDFHSNYELFQVKELFYDYTIADIDPLFKLYQKVPEAHVHTN